MPPHYAKKMAERLSGKPSFFDQFMPPPTPLTRLRRLRLWAERTRERLGEIIAGKKFYDEQD